MTKKGHGGEEREPVGLPQTVKLGALRYRVKLMPSLAREDGQQLLGEHDYMALELRE